MNCRKLLWAFMAIGATTIADGARWFSIGGDASTTTVNQASWNGAVAIARVYDAPLTATEVSELFKASKISK